MGNFVRKAENMETGCRDSDVHQWAMNNGKASESGEQDDESHIMQFGNFGSQ